MNAKASSFSIVILLLLLSCFSQISIATHPGEIQSGNVSLEYHNVTVYAPAVAQTEKGYVGVISTITATIQSNGSGRVFVDTLAGSGKFRGIGALPASDNKHRIDPFGYAPGFPLSVGCVLAHGIEGRQFRKILFCHLG